MAITDTRIAPHSVEAEEATLGSILINSDTLLEVVDLLAPGDFFIIRHGWVYEAILRLYERKEAIDYLTVVKELEAHGQLEEIGGRAYVMYLINNTPTSIHAETYARQVRRYAARRGLLEMAGMIAESAYDEEQELDAIMTDAERMFLDTADRAEPDSLEAIDSIMPSHYDMVERLYLDGAAPTIPTGLLDVDKIIGGLLPGDLSVVCGRPGMGKTSLLLSVALHMFLSGYRVAFFSMEMKKLQLVSRLASMVTGVDAQKFRIGNITDKDWETYIDKAVNGFSNHPNLLVSDRAGLSPGQLRQMVRKAWLRRVPDGNGGWRPGVDVIVVDYLQLMRVPGYVGKDNRVQEVGEITAALKTAAFDLNVPVLAAAQLNRNCEMRQDKRPTMADIRESGAVENDADMIFGLYRDAVYNPDTEDPNIAEFNIIKNRHGPVKMIELYFDAPHTRYTDLIRADDIAPYRARGKENGKQKSETVTGPAMIIEVADGAMLDRIRAGDQAEVEIPKRNGDAIDGPPARRRVLTWDRYVRWQVGKVAVLKLKQATRGSDRVRVREIEDADENWRVQFLYVGEM